MNRPATEAELKQARRNQEFSDKPMGMALCGLAAKEVAIFPVRYALDESPTEKGSPQGPNPLPKDWPSPSPALQTRSYTLRQLRDGWLYVWDSVDETFDEYQVEAEYFIRHPWTEAQLNQDIRHNPGESLTYLLYPRRSQLRIAYSPVQWTWRICELMRSNAGAQNQWMRAVDLSDFCRTGTAEHGAYLEELGNSVADVLVHGQQPPAFASTLLPSQPSDARPAYKEAFEEALVRGRVPDQDTALFVALDDPLAMVDDLSMNLSGRLLEYSQFEGLHQQKLESAIAVHSLCGFDVDTFIPQSLSDPLQRQAYSDDLYTLLAAHDEIEQATDVAGVETSGMVLWAAGPLVAEAQATFKSRWGHLPDQKKWQTALEGWNDKRLWREDVRFDEVRHYLSETACEVLRLQAHCKRSEDDLLAWLDRLGPSAEDIYHDTCNAGQTSQLLETAHMVYTLLANGEKGQKWLCQQAERPSTLFGLALFNFDAEVAAVIKQVTLNFSRTGNLDDQGRDSDGSTAALNPASVGDITSLGTRANEIKGVLDLEAVKNSAAYKAMSDVGKRAMNTLVQVANDHAKAAWHGLSILLLPAMKRETALVLAVPQVLFSHEISIATQLTINSAYPHDFQAWLREVVRVQKDINRTQSILHRPNPPHDQRAARNALRSLEEQFKHLMLLRPNQITANAVGSTRLSAGAWTVNNWLADLGRAEVLAQLKLHGTTDYLNRVNAWMSRQLGNALPALVVGLNVWNLHNSATQAINDGRFTADEWRSVTANAAYAANALAALWVGPAWSQAGGMSAQMGRKTVAVAEAGYVEWLSKARAASSSGAEAAVASEFAAASKGLILRTVTWAALGAVAAAVEAWQIFKDADRATSEDEKTLLQLKLGIVAGMFLVSGAQTVGAALGYWIGFSWVMSTPVTIILALLGISYLLISMAANRYKREGLRLWLYRCKWGRGAVPEWQNGEKGFRQQMAALLETLQRPSVVGKAIYQEGERLRTRWQGFWLHIQVPRLLAGRELTLQPAMIETNDPAWPPLPASVDLFYSRFTKGNWIDPHQLGQLPGAPGNIDTVDFVYDDQHQHFLWQVWIETPKPRPVMELEVKYPPGVLQRSDGRGYMFRVAFAASTREADRLNNAFSGELKEEDDIVLGKERNRVLTLAVPNVTKRSPDV
jgi:hypothetical protein